MKLIDLLVRELKHWPDDVHCMTQDSDGDLNWHNNESTPELNDEGVTWKCDDSWMDYHRGWEISDDWKTAIVTRDQYKSALAASQKAEWSGAGLPPVGCECEYQYKVHGSEWCKFECVAVDGKAVFGWSNNTPIAMQSNTHNFRPLRSEADKKRDAAISAMVKSTYGPNEYTYQEICELVYADIASGKIPGVKLED